MAERFSKITQYIPQLESGELFAAIVREETEPGVTVLPTVEYTPLAKAIIGAFHEITDNDKEYSMDMLLAAYEHSPFAETVITEVEVDSLDAKSVLALIAAVLHMERWDNGTLYSFYYSGKLLESLKRLKKCDMQSKRCLCPILNKEIAAYDCFDAALVYEELSPLSELPKDMIFTDENQDICLRCQYHPR